MSSLLQQVPERVRAEVLQGVVEIFANVLRVDPSSLPPAATLPEIGVDSMAVFEVLDPIKERYGVGLSMRTVYNDLNSIDAIASFVAKEVSASESPPDSSKPTKPAANTVTLPKSTNDAIDVHRLIQGQLEIMALQLSLLEGGDRSVERPGVGEGATVAKASAAEGMSFIQVPPRKTSEAATKQSTYLEGLAKRYNARTARSKAHAAEFRHVVADSRNSIGFDHDVKELLYPIVAETMRGARVRDIDGNDYVDMTMGFGVHLLGHAPDVVTRAMTDGSDFGIGLRDQNTLDVARLVTKLTGMDRVVFVNDGTEAVMSAIKAVRASTGRDTIVLFKQCYHGHWDGVLAHPSASGRSRPLYAGVTEGSVQDAIVFDYGSPEALRFVREHGREIAAVLVEPIPLRDPRLANADFLFALREATLDAGVLLIFDEIVTGFRCHPGGIQGLYGIRADLAIYGKAIGGGMPIGVVAGREHTLDAIDGGSWDYGDDSTPSARAAMVGGTFFQHPLSMRVAKAVLTELDARGPALQASLNRRTSRFVDDLNEIFRTAGAPIEARGFASFFRLFSKERLAPLYYNLLLRGVYIWEWRSWFLSAAHDDEHLARVTSAMKESVEELRANGCL